MDFFTPVPPMGIYETLYAFLKASGAYMGDPGTHPWSQGFPLTKQLPGGPELPQSIGIEPDDLRYPKAWGLPALREAIANYYRDFYGANVTKENVMIFAGGRPAIVAALMFLAPDVRVRIASTEYTPYYDLLKFFGRRYDLVLSSVENRFVPPVDSMIERAHGERSMLLLSNPCNPTGVTRSGEELERLVESASDRLALLFDEAYELFHEAPVSAAQYVKDFERGNTVIIGAATKGLQAPGIRIGWLLSSKENVDIFGNFSSFGMGGVSHLSQRYALALMERKRIEKARVAVPAFYREQRDRYREGLTGLGLELFTGEGGFYHWCKLPDGLTASELNRRLFSQKAAILEGPHCDMARLGERSPLSPFFRFSFGPLEPASYESDIRILQQALERR